MFRSKPRDLVSDRREIVAPCADFCGKPWQSPFEPQPWCLLVLVSSGFSTALLGMTVDTRTVGDLVWTCRRTSASLRLVPLYLVSSEGFAEESLAAMIFDDLSRRPLGVTDEA